MAKLLSTISKYNGADERGEKRIVSKIVEKQSCAQSHIYFTEGLCYHVLKCVGCTLLKVMEDHVFCFLVFF
jgi:hypothetical protein